MSVFTWQQKTVDPDAMSQDEFRTAWAITRPVCIFCGDTFARGDLVWHWHGSVETLAHAKCIKQNARGILRDISECMR